MFFRKTRSEPAVTESERALISRQIDDLRSRGVEDREYFDRRLRELGEALAGLRDELQAAVRDNAQLRVEWAETLGKVASIAARMSARERKKINQADEAGGDGDQIPLPGPLTPEQEKHQLRQRVFNMRRGGR